jgi:hypothetical protein
MIGATMVRTLLLGCASVLFLAATARADWNPEVLGRENTLQFSTVSPDDGEHWSTVWLVLVDGQIFVRLGDRAADRMRNSTRWPYVDVRIGDETFENVRVEPTPQMEGHVADAMAEKYWMDILFRHIRHPLTARLAPAEPGAR